MNTGTVKFFNTTKGFGFIKNDETGEETFVHISALGDIVLNENDKVTYETEQSTKGLNAINVKLID